MRVYFDNNILVLFENKKIEIPILNKYSYVYSYTHIQELMEAKIDFDKLKQLRLTTIQYLTKNTYIFPNNDKIYEKIEPPEKVFLTLQLFSGLTNKFRQSVNNFNVDRQKLIQILNIDTRRINNYSHIEVIEYFENALNSHLSFNLNHLIDLSGNSLREKISTIFNWLDFIGFWKDKETHKSNLARTYDSSHTYFASYCNLFVSNDKRTRNKAKVAYKYYNIDTKVLSFEEFLGLDKTSIQQ